MTKEQREIKREQRLEMAEAKIKAVNNFLIKMKEIYQGDFTNKFLYSEIKYNENAKDYQKLLKIKV